MKSSSKFKDPSELVLIGKVVAAHGIKGAVKVISYAESVDIFQAVDILWTPSVRRTVDGSFDCLKVTWAKPHKQNIRLGFTEVINRDQAEEMVGMELFLEKSRLPELEDDTYYWFDLIGIAVKTVDDEFIGHIERILPTGGNDVYVVKHADACGEKERLIPAVADVIQRIDLDKKTMVVDLPEGL